MIFCEHKDERETGLACEHLLQKEVGKKYYPISQKHHRYFTGKDVEFVLICPACANDPMHGEVYWRTICRNCCHSLGVNGKINDLGCPQILVRDAGLTIKHEAYDVPEGMMAFSAVASLGKSNDGAWVMVTAQHHLVIARPADGRWETVVELAALPINPERPVSLATSDDGRYVAIVNTYDSKGCVWDMVKRAVVLSFDRKDEENEHCRYPVAFVEHDGKVFAVYGTDSNRLDVTELETGRLMTARELPSSVKAFDRPPHYLDYYHCSLSVSPDGEWIADNGWVWHPAGVVTAWNLKRWLYENVWESEDGPSNRGICSRVGYWDGPLCWVDKQTLAVWGLGDDDCRLAPGVILFDVSTGLELNRFNGPVGGSAYEQAPGGYSMYRAVGKMLFDRWLFSWLPGKPFGVWDVKDGARLLEVPDFSPLAYHHGTKEFLSIRPDGKLDLSRLS